MESNKNYFEETFEDEIVGDVACCNIRDCYFKNVKYAVFDRCNITNCTFETGTSFIKCNLLDCVTEEDTIFEDSNVDFSEDQEQLDLELNNEEEVVEEETETEDGE